VFSRQPKLLKGWSCQRLVRLGLLIFLAFATRISSSYATMHANCPPDVRGCSPGCCFICFLTGIGFDSDGTVTCDYSDCYSNCV
jgi:hypothetical protein